MSLVTLISRAGVGEGLDGRLGGGGRWWLCEDGGLVSSMSHNFLGITGEGGVVVVRRCMEGIIVLVEINEFDGDMVVSWGGKMVDNFAFLQCVV